MITNKTITIESSFRHYGSVLSNVKVFVDGKIYNLKSWESVNLNFELGDKKNIIFQKWLQRIELVIEVKNDITVKIVNQFFLGTITLKISDKGSCLLIKKRWIGEFLNVLLIGFFPILALIYVLLFVV